MWEFSAFPPLQEVVRCPRALMPVLISRCRVELCEFNLRLNPPVLPSQVINVIRNLHNRRLVPAPIAVIRRAEDGNDLIVMLPLVPLHNQLMSPADKAQVINMSELLRDVLPERVPRPSRADPPPAPIVRVAPNQVAHGSFMWYFLDSIELPGVVEGVDAWGEAAVEAEDLVGYDGGHGEVVERVGEVLPDVRVTVLAEALGGGGGGRKGVELG